MIAKPSIHPLAAQHLRELREKWGVEPTLEETLWVVQLCEKVLNPGIGAHASLIGIPERVGGSDVWLWPPTIGAAVWWREFALAWWAQDEERASLSLAFALAHARDRETLTACRTQDATEAMIHDWSLSLTCTRAELNDAVDRIYSETERPRKRNDSAKVMDWSSLIAELEVSSGLPSDRWIWSVSRAHTIEAWHASKRVIAAQGGYPSGRTDAADEAIQDLAFAKDAIIRAHQPEDAP